ncbi:MAG: LptF/LptG family permease, partial [Bacteroidales bacterium]|nr:LptF/LptG family permease [Bacteroidales bacterium]
MQKPHIKILDRYIIRKFLGTFIFTILIAVVIVIVFDLSEKISKFVDKEVPLKEIVFEYYAGFIPWIVNSFSPLFVFISAIFFTSKMAQNSEIVAMLSGGISFRRLMAPYMFSAGVIALLSLVLGLYVIPPANEHRLAFENKYIKTQQIAADNLRNIHYQLSPGEFVYVEQFSRWANTAYRFTLERVEKGRIISKLSAESAAWDSTLGGWKLKNYYIRDFYGESEVVRTGRQIDTVISLTIDDFYRRKNIVESLSERDLNDLI